ncbi:MAG TPA: XRE family transcriptional regulator [Candidatus Anaerofilum faecale]|nr:XRE family transcriptional regulator [Anaerofilum sp. An201]OUP05122.1 transcriptional regulator [Anaerofilum sp. An201]HIX12060.1 XRE family transcriptional regulator [Candidatus Anaerofilum faecale]
MFKQRLKEMRTRRGFTQVGLSRMLGISQQAVGKWETGRCTPDPQTLARLASILDTTVDYLLGGNSSGVGECMVPVLGTVKAGFGALAYQEDCGSEPANVKDPGQYFYLIVRGDSMEPRIHDGDLALVHRQPTLESGELGVVVYGDGEGTLKKYIRQGQAVILQPFNPAYPSQVIAGEELEHLYIAGRVVETKTKW